MIIPGLVSVTFRQLSPSEIIALAKKAGLRAIEWGGDVHVPHGDIGLASEVGKLTRYAGLTVASYGSYFCLGKSLDEGLEFSDVLDTAIALGAPVIRIWAGSCGSAEASGAEREKLLREAREIAKAAMSENIKISMEFHAGTIADDAESAMAFINECGSGNILTHWQPSGTMTHIERKNSLVRVLPHLSCIHAFAWEKPSGGPSLRLPLAAHADKWMEYFSVVPKGRFHYYALLEFVKDDSPDLFLSDAAELRRLLLKTGQYDDSLDKAESQSYTII